MLEKYDENYFVETAVGTSKKRNSHLGQSIYVKKIMVSPVNFKIFLIRL